MSRKRIVVSLADDLSSQSLVIGGWQIAFVLIPTELDSPYELFKTVHPIVWEVYDCSLGEPQAWEYDGILGVSTVKKEPDESVVPVLSRMIPLGHHTALTRVQGRTEWCETKRYKEDMPTTIVITNDSDVEQSFAVCLVKNAEQVPRFSPIVMFNRIPHGQHLHVEGEFQLRAFLGRGLKQMQMVPQREDGTFDHMQPVLDTDGMEWVTEVDDLPTLSSFHVSQLSSGSAVITVEEEVQIAPGNTEILQDVGVLKERLRDIQLHVSRALGNESLALQRLRKEVQRLNDKTEFLKADVEGGNARADAVGRAVVDIVTEVVQSREATTKLQKNVERVAGETQTLFTDVGRMASTVSSMHQRITAVGEKVQDVELKIGTIDGISEESRQISQSVRDIRGQLRAKASTSDLETIRRELAVKMNQVEGDARETKTSLGTIENRVDSVAGSTKTFQGNIKLLLEKIEDDGEVPRRLKASEETIEKLQLVNKEMKEKHGKVDGEVVEIRKKTKGLDAAMSMLGGNMEGFQRQVESELHSVDPFPQKFKECVVPASTIAQADERRCTEGAVVQVYSRTSTVTNVKMAQKHTLASTTGPRLGLVLADILSAIQAIDTRVKNLEAKAQAQEESGSEKTAMQLAGERDRKEVEVQAEGSGQDEDKSQITEGYVQEKVGEGSQEEQEEAKGRSLEESGQEKTEESGQEEAESHWRTMREHNVGTAEVEVYLAESSDCGQGRVEIRARKEGSQEGSDDTSRTTRWKRWRTWLRRFGS